MSKYNITKQWLAGFIDGEGCFNITRCRTTIYPRLLIVNTNLDILEEIKKRYGGDITSRKNGKDNWKTFNSYRASCKAFKRIVSDVLPYLNLKKENALLCLEMLKTKDMSKRITMKDEMNKLNKKGIAIAMSVKSARKKYSKIK